MNKISALFLAANPIDTSRLSLDSELRSIQEKIRASEYRDSVEIVSKWAVRPDDLIQHLNAYRPQIVHFSGHGTSAGELVLVDSTGAAKAVSPNAIKLLFNTLKGNIRLVILNSCYSKIQAQAIVEVVDCAVGISEQIEDKAAIIFISSFYRAIGFGRSIKEAFEQGKLALLLEGISEENVPQLLSARGIDPNDIILTSEDNAALPLINKSIAPHSREIKAFELTESGDYTSQVQSKPTFYYCYISRTKVEQILSQNRVNNEGAIKHEAIQFKNGDGSLSILINNLFSADGEYGNPRVLHIAQGERATLVAKLLAAMRCLETQIKIPWLMDHLKDVGTLSPGAYLYQGEFKVSRYDEKFAYLKSIVGSDVNIILSCSLKHFSDMAEEDQKILPHSGNRLFFDGEITPNFQSLLYILQAKNNNLFGTPLYLGLPLDSTLQL